MRPLLALLCVVPLLWVGLSAQKNSFGVVEVAGSREPSGVVSLPEHKGVLVVDDEPKETRDSLGLFFYRKVGKMWRALPVTLHRRQKRKWNDWEGVTRTDRDIYLLASHSGHKKKRAKICTFPISALRLSLRRAILTRRLRCWGGKRQRYAIQRELLRAGKRIGFRLTTRRINLEGIAYDVKRKHFWVGVRGPLAWHQSKKHAILLSMHIGRKLTFRYAGLLGFDGRGIRGMTWLPSRELAVLAGPEKGRGSFDLYTVRWSKKSFRVRRLTPRGFPTHVRPEGLTVWKQRLLICSDTGSWYSNRPASFLFFPLRASKSWSSSH